MIPRIHRIFSFLLLVAAVSSGPATAAITSCIASPGNGENAQSNVAAPNPPFKGIFLFCTGDSNLDISGTNVTLTFSGGPDPPACDNNEPLPDPGLCGFVASGMDLTIYYNGLMPAGTVTVDVQDLGDADPLTDHDQNWTFNVSATPPRDPAAVELVFDVSGSMGWDAVPGGTVDRLTALKSAAQVFFDLFEDYAISGDQVGAIYFNQTASAFDAPPGNNLKAADNPGELGSVETDLMGQTDGGSTSIGAGLDLADSPTGFDTTTARKFVLLFSDGEQNEPPNVSVGADLEVGGAVYDTDITVCPITAGLMTAPGFALQQQIADARCDSNNAHIRNTEETFVTADLETFFLQNLADILVGDKLEMVRDVNGTIQAGENIEIPFLANPDDILLSLLVSTSGGTVTANFNLPFELEAPDGTLIDLVGRTRFGLGMSFTTLRLPVVQDGAAVPVPGEWRVRLRGDDLPGGEIGYHVAVLLDNMTLVSEFASEVADPGTGEPIPLRVTLSEAGNPVSGATVRARLVGPEKGLGEILSDAPAADAPADAGGNPVANGKLFNLLNDPQLSQLLADQDLGLVNLSEDEPGVYRGSFNGAEEEGHYQFVLDVEANAPLNQDYQRTRRLSVFVRPKPDPARTDLVIAGVQTIEEGQIFRVTVHATPRDRFRNRIGPGYLGHLRIAASSGLVVQPLTDLGNGTYEIVLELGPNDDPDIGLEVLDEPIESDELSDLGPDWPPHGARKGRWSFHLGWTDPHGPLGAVADGDWSLGIDRRFKITDRFDVEIYLGHDRFDPLFGSDLYFTMLTGRARYYFTGGPVRPSIFGGLGPFLDSADDVNLGLEIGVAVEFPIAPQLGLELSYTHRNVDNQIDYGLAQVGLLVDF